jgi:hypothetical protein
VGGMNHSLEVFYTRERLFRWGVLLKFDGKQKRRRPPAGRLSFTVLAGLRDDDNLHHGPRAGVDKHDVLAPEEILDGAATLHHDDIRR